MNATLAPERLVQIEKRARRRVARKLGFGVHLLAYTLVNGGLWLLHQATGDGHASRALMFGWGLGLAIHGIVTVVGLAGDGLRERLLAGEIERLKQRDAGQRSR